MTFPASLYPSYWTGTLWATTLEGPNYYYSSSPSFDLNIYFSSHVSCSICGKEMVSPVVIIWFRGRNIALCGKCVELYLSDILLMEVL